MAILGRDRGPRLNVVPSLLTSPLVLFLCRRRKKIWKVIVTFAIVLIADEEGMRMRKELLACSSVAAR